MALGLYDRFKKIGRFALPFVAGAMLFNSTAALAYNKKHSAESHDLQVAAFSNLGYAHKLHDYLSSIEFGNYILRWKKGNKVLYKVIIDANADGKWLRAFKNRLKKVYGVDSFAVPDYYDIKNGKIMPKHYHGLLHKKPKISGKKITKRIKRNSIDELVQGNRIFKRLTPRQKAYQSKLGNSKSKTSYSHGKKRVSNVKRYVKKIRDIEKIIAEVEEHYGIKHCIEGLVQTESAFNQYAKSYADAYGLTQMTQIAVKEVYEASDKDALRLKKLGIYDEVLKLRLNNYTESLDGILRKLGVSEKTLRKGFENSGFKDFKSYKNYIEFVAVPYVNKLNGWLPELKKIHGKYNMRELYNIRNSVLMGSAYFFRLLLLLSTATYKTYYVKSHSKGKKKKLRKVHGLGYGNRLYFVKGFGNPLIPPKFWIQAAYNTYNSSFNYIVRKAIMSLRNNISFDKIRKYKETEEHWRRAREYIYKRHRIFEKTAFMRKDYNKRRM